MISYKAKKSRLYSEFSSEQSKEYFDFTQKNFMHNIDTLYYVIKVKNDWRECPNVHFFKSLLIQYQEKAYEVASLPVFTKEDMEKLQLPELFPGDDWVMNGVAASKIYRYDLTQQDKYSVFIAENNMNQNTPELIVQIRSQFLWLEGEKQAVIKSLNAIEDLLRRFNIDILEVKENRIDYAYHTNYIQDPTSYFKHQNIAKMQQSRFTRGSVEFSFRNQFITETDYLTLGRKKSNNLFFRIYDKTKEVIQQGYKQFFIEMWHQNKMISTFDKYCIEKAFLNPSADNFKYLDIARLEFYLDFGKNEVIKQDIRSLIYTKKARNYPKIIALADELTPPVTKVLNVELETKRKFYSTLDNFIFSFLEVTSDVPDYAKRLFRILDNKKMFHDFITRNTEDGSGVIRFLDYRAKNRLGKPWAKKKDFPTSDFWKRLQNLQLDNRKVDEEMIRQYQKSVSLHLMKKRLVNSVSTFSLYQSLDLESNAIEDALDFISTINESDLERAVEYKEKKFLLLKNRIADNEVTLEKELNVGIIDFTTGEILKPTSTQDDDDSQEYNIDKEKVELDSSASYDDILVQQYEELKKEYDFAKLKLKEEGLTEHVKAMLRVKMKRLDEKMNDLLY